MIRMYCYCGYGVWMHFRLEHGLYRPCFTSSQSQAKAITHCPGCGNSLDLMVTHLELDDMRHIPTTVLGAAMPMLSGQSTFPILLPAIGEAAI